MNSAIVVVGLALVLAVQVAIHLRIAGIPARIAAMKQVADGRGRPEADAFQEALARRLNLIVRGIQGYHDQIAEDFRAQVAAGEQRARLAEGKRGDAVGVASELRALARDMAAIASELRTLQGDFAELVCSAAETKGAPPSAVQPAPKEAPPPEDPDERKTIEMPAPASCAPPAGAANDGADDEGWDDPEEQTKLFAKDAQPAVLFPIRQAVLAGASTPRPAGAKGARSQRHALRPPPPPLVDEGDDAMERPSIFPAARRS